MLKSLSKFKKLDAYNIQKTKKSKKKNQKI